MHQSFMSSMGMRSSFPRVNFSDVFTLLNWNSHLHTEACRDARFQRLLAPLQVDTVIALVCICFCANGRTEEQNFSK